MEILTRSLKIFLVSNMILEQLLARFKAITRSESHLPSSSSIGKSRQGRVIQGFSRGTGAIKISLIAGCHADEPVGPLLLSKAVNYLDTLAPEDPMLTEYQWHIIPHANPDGRELNNRWWREKQEQADLLAYLKDRIRELPGDDMEFGFPRYSQDSGARVENRVIYDWWSNFATSFDLHVSLHGMGFSAGPWYLVEEAWKERIGFLKTECLRFVRQKGYRPHDVDRQGEKGFFRLGKGFCTRPDSKYMQQYFLKQGDEQTAALFWPSSMETMRAFGGDCFAIVSEMPLFLLPDVGIAIGPPDQAALAWKERIARWQTLLKTPETIREESQRLGLQAMNITDQMHFQWHFICSALEQIRITKTGC